MTAVLALLLVLRCAWAVGPPPEVVDATIDEHLGAEVPGDLVFTDTTGARVRLGDVIEGDRPVVLVLAYFRCPMLCGLVLEGAASAVAELRRRGVDVPYRLVTVSFDPEDDPAAAADAQARVLGIAGLDRADWPFLVGEQAAVDPLLDALGAHVQRVAEDQYAHPAAVYVLTPDRRISRYLYGARPDPDDLALALQDAADGRTGGSLGGLLLACFRFSPALREHAGAIALVLKGGGVLVLGGGALALGLLWWRDGRRA